MLFKILPQDHVAMYVEAPSMLCALGHWMQQHPGSIVTSVELLSAEVFPSVPFKERVDSPTCLGCGRRL